MGKMTAVKRVVLNERHKRPSQTMHFLNDGQGRPEFPPFTSLMITQCPENPGNYFLLSLCDNVQVADTFHLTLDDALHQAEYEFGVRPEEWTDTNEPF
jgi:hypothetical protein